MKDILIIQGGGRPGGNIAQMVDSFVRGTKEAGHRTEVVSLIRNEVKGCQGCNACRYGKPCIQKDAFNEIAPKIRAVDCLAQEDNNPPFGRYEKYPMKDCALLMTSADNFFWTFEQAVSYYNFALVNYIGFRDKGMLLAGGCGDTDGRPQIDKTSHLQKAYEFGKRIYQGE